MQFCLILYHDHYTINNDYTWYYICSTWFLDIIIPTCLLSLLYHYLMSINTITAKSLPLLQNLLDFLLQFTEMGYYNQNRRYQQKYNSMYNVICTHMVDLCRLGHVSFMQPDCFHICEKQVWLCKTMVTYVKNFKGEKLI